MRYNSAGSEGIMMAQVLRQLAPPWLRHGVKWAARPTYRRDYRELRRLEALPRYQPTVTTLLGTPVRLIDAASFLSAYQHIIRDEIYRFEAARPDPLILDGGANIGLAVLYWKRLYPAARITAFEPDPAAYEALAWNCARWGLAGVELHQQAVWRAEETLSFWSEGADGGRLPVGPENGGSRISVPAVRLRDYLGEPVDLLKLDIEGAEVDVLLDCAGALDTVAHLFVEYHSFIDHEQRLDDLLGVLRSAGFRLHIQPELVSPQPFVNHLDENGMDQRLNIFAYRRESRP
jgi:FkbM family methyltransferase